MNLILLSKATRPGWFRNLSHGCVPAIRKRLSQLASGRQVRTVNDMNGSQNHAFGQLLAAWRRREDARSSTEIRQLAEARFALDNARAAMRSSLGPTR